jgi:replication-associated recombination protein RarA
MKTSEIFQRIVESNLSGIELETIELLEDSFADITKENQSDYMSIENYFNAVKQIFPNNKTISSNDLKNYVKEIISNYDDTDLLFFDGLNSLSECLIKYGGNDDLKFFEDWFYDRVRKVNSV